MTGRSILSIAILTASLLCMLAVAPAFSQTNEPSLGEVARKNRAGKPKPPANKEIKEELSSRPMSTATVTNYGSSAEQGSSSSENSSSATPTSEATGTKNTEAQSTSETKPQDAGAAKSEPETKEDRVAQLKKDKESLNQMIEKLQGKLEAETDPARRQTWGELIRNAESEREKKTRELSEAEKSAPK